MSERSYKNDLVAFAGPVFDLILRVKAGIVQPSMDLRPTIASLLSDFEARAERYRYSSKIIQVAKFALASFVDETVLTNQFHLKEEWEKFPLQLEYFGEQLAGNKFFEKLAAMLKQIDVTADAVEIYYVCMLLGFKGRYAVYEKERLLTIMQETANGLVRAGKIRTVELSPHWLADDQPEPPKPKKMPAWAKVTAAGGLGFAFIIYLVMWIVTSKFLQDAVDKLVF
jgi:type VI secretion system protein ImpK